MSVILRTKIIRDGRKSLYLVCYDQGQRHFVFVELYLNKERETNKSIMELAHKVRLQKEVEQSSGRLGISLSGKLITITDLIDRFAQDKGETNRKHYLLMKYHLIEFGGGGLRVKSITSQWDELQESSIGKS